MYFYIFLLLVIKGLFSSEIVFVHIPKTGGKTIQHILTKEAHDKSIYPLKNIDNSKLFVTTPWVCESIIKMKPSIDQDIVFGHLPLWFLKAKDPNYNTAFFFTVLRDPVERVISHAFHHRRHGCPHFSPLNISPNYMCRMLTSDYSLEGEALLENAIQNLHKMDLIIFFDDYINGVKNLNKHLGFSWDEIPKCNENKHYPKKSRAVSIETLKDIRRINSLDVRLYQYAIENFKASPL